MSNVNCSVTHNRKWSSTLPIPFRYLFCFMLKKQQLITISNQPAQHQTGHVPQDSGATFFIDLGPVALTPLLADCVERKSASVLFLCRESTWPPSLCWEMALGCRGPTLTIADHIAETPTSFAHVIFFIDFSSASNTLQINTYLGCLFNMNRKTAFIPCTIITKEDRNSKPCDVLRKRARDT